MDDHGTASLPHGGGDRLAVEGRDGEQIDDLCLHAVLVLEGLGRLAGHTQHGTIGDEGEVAPLTRHLGSAEGQRLRLVRHLLPRGVIEGLRLEEDHRVWIANGRDEQGPRACGGQTG